MIIISEKIFYFVTIINNYLKNLTIDKAILIAKQFCIDFSYEEMRLALPFLKQGYDMLLEKPLVNNIKQSPQSRIPASHRYQYQPAYNL